MRMFSTNNNVFEFVRRPRRQLGLLMAGAVMGLAAASWGIPQQIVLSNAAPYTASAFLTNGFVGATPTNWTLNVPNNVDIDPNAGEAISLETRPIPSTIIFAYWTGDLTNDMTADAILNPVIKDLIVYAGGTLTANYTNKAALKVVSANPAQGSTTPVSSGGTTNIPVGRPIALTAVPATGFDFWYWTNTSGNISISASNSATTFVTVNAVAGNPTVTAFFRAKKRLTVNTSSGQGLVYMSSPDSLPLAIQTNVFFFNNNEPVSLTAQGLNGQVFKKWTAISGGSVLSPTSPNTTITMTNDTLLTVDFGPPGKILIVLAGDNGVTTPSGTNEYASDSYVDITATANGGYGFVKWTTVNGGTVTPIQYESMPSFTIQMNQNRDYKAWFTNLLSVTVTDAGGPGTGDTDFQVLSGGSWTTNPPRSQMAWGGGRIQVSGWTNGTGNVLPGGSGNSVTVNKATQNSSFTWVWQQYYSLSTEAQGGGSIFPATDSNLLWRLAGSTNSITALPSAGYALVGWTVNNVALSHRDTTFNLIMDGSKSVVAIFQEITDNSDSDHLPDWWEKKYGLDQYNIDGQDGDDGDPDRDGLNNFQEFALSITNSPTGVQYFMNPLNADTDSDGMDDYFEVFKMASTNALPGDVSAAMVALGLKGADGNPDGDLLWNTTNGYREITRPLSNIEEWRGPDSVDPCIYETVPWTAAFSNAPAGVTRQSVRWRTPSFYAVPNYFGTDDQSTPQSVDTDDDTFDDGYEFSWDQWQQQHQGESILKNPAAWPTMNQTVPSWDTARRYNPNAKRNASSGDLTPDFDRIYDPQTGRPTAPWGDLSEYQASSTNYTIGTNLITIVRDPNMGGAPRCSNPFMWDADGDALPDGWEISFGYDPWDYDSDNNGDSDGIENPDGDGFAFTGRVPYDLNGTTNMAPICHELVFDQNGFNPWTGWTLHSMAVDTAPYSNVYEMVGAELSGLTNKTMGWIPGAGAWSTNPKNVDTDDDGVWDGWELYTGGNPNTAPNAILNGDPDSLLYWQEFMSASVIADWRRLGNARQTPLVTNANWFAFSDTWPNKLLPTNPNESDTDGDQITDGFEQRDFNYQAWTNELIIIPPAGLPIQRGGGLDPCTVDTDADYLPDFWEAYFPGAFGTGAVTVVLTTNILTGVVTTNVNSLTFGMDGTVGDSLGDSDGDGLYNYQEYLVGACYQFQYAYNSGELTYTDPMGNNFDPYDFFDVTLSGGDPQTGPGAMAPRAWDKHFWANPTPSNLKPYTFLSAGYNVLTTMPPGPNFSTCDPSTADTDHDGFDDFYELYHGLNPIRGEFDRVSGKLRGVSEASDSFYGSEVSYDNGWWFRWGEKPHRRAADYDQDGLVDVEENLTVDLPTALTYTHTDPSPYSITDFSSPASYVNRFYKTGKTFGGMAYWYWDHATLFNVVINGRPPAAAAYLFSFEVNEGYDTDNDLLADAVEVRGGSVLNPEIGASDPLDDDSPIKQRALYLNGVDSAARMYTPTFHSWYSFRSFTVEAWVRPDSLGGDQVVVERAGMVDDGNPGLPQDRRVVRNFRLGVKNGTPYAFYDGFGTNWATEVVMTDPQYTLVPKEWTHLALVFSETQRRLMLYVNGELASSKSVALIPFNGYIAQDPTHPDTRIAQWMMVTIGASDHNTDAKCDGTLDNVQSGKYSLEWGGSGLDPTPPDLHDYFHGYMDEIHLWDGVRSPDQIKAMKSVKLTRARLNEINGVQTGNQSFAGDMGGSELNPKMLYAYTFDGLPDPTQPCQGIVPEGFDTSVDPTGWSQVEWWANFSLASSVYTDRRYVKWIQNMATHQPFDPPRDTRSVKWIENGRTNNFPNTSNPYTVEYIHGQGGSWEVHPQYSVTTPIMFYDTIRTNQSFLREFSGIYGDLLPLGGARGAEGIPMWDGSTPNDKLRDEDGDGMPDWWEQKYGLDPYDPLNADDDPDHDGQSNRQEYYMGTDPVGSYSVTPRVSDFFAYTNGLAGPFRFLGEKYTDMDYIEDFWEAAYGLNTEMFDAAGPNADPDNDGWSNLAESQELANRVGTSGGFLSIATNPADYYAPLAYNEFYQGLLVERGVLSSTNDPIMRASMVEWNDPRDEARHPVPKLRFRFNYTGMQRTLANPHFIVLAYSDRLMEIPDASIRGVSDRYLTYPRYMDLNMDRSDVFDFTLPMWDDQDIFSDWDEFFYKNIGQGNAYAFEGNVREGLNWFWGFMDLNGDNEYQAGEPAGFAGPVNVRWGHVGPIDIPLTDRRPMGFARFSWPEDPSADGYHVSIVDRNLATAPTVFERDFPPARTFVHEGDLMAFKKLGKGFKRSGGYQYYVRSLYDNVLHDRTNGMAYVNYKYPMPAPKLIWPVGKAPLRQSRDVFVWKMDSSVTKCSIMVKRLDTGALVLNQTFTPPARDVNGQYEMEMPIYIGDGVFQKAAYEYTLTVQNPLGKASSTSQFTVETKDYPGYAYSLTGSFIYPGKVPNGVFVAEAFTSPGFGGMPAGRCLIPNTITSAAWPTNVMAFTIRGVPAGTYYVRVFLDQNDSYPNYKADDFESQGWLSTSFYWPKSVEVSSTATTVIPEWIKVLMRDTDNDRLPDDWEFRWNGNFTAFGSGPLRYYTPALNGVDNVFECYGKVPLGVSPF